jgi:hypothetical protein
MEFLEFIFWLLSCADAKGFWGRAGRSTRACGQQQKSKPRGVLACSLQRALALIFLPCACVDNKVRAGFAFSRANPPPLLAFAHSRAAAAFSLSPLSPLSPVAGAWATG